MITKKTWASLFLSATLLLSPLSAHQVEAAPASNYHYEITTKTTQTSQLSRDYVYMRNGTLYVQMNSLANSYGLDVSFDSTGKRAGFNGWLKKFAVRDGSPTAILDGKTIKLTQPAYFTKEKDSKDPIVYVPFQFAVEALDGTYIGYNAKTKTVKAKNLKSYDALYKTMDGKSYAVDRYSGNVFSWNGKDKPVKIASIKADNLDSLDFEVRKTPKGLVLLTIENWYGEPHINNEQYQLLFKDGKLIRQAYADFGWGRADQTDTYNGNILLNDSKKLRVIEDGTGNVLNTLDLVKLGNRGSDHSYNVEAMDDDMLLIRDAKLLYYDLLLVNRHSGRSVTVYKEVLSAAQQKEIEPLLAESGPFSIGDGLKFQKRVGDLVYFTFESPVPGGGDTTPPAAYDLSKLK